AAKTTRLWSRRPALIAGAIVAVVLAAALYVGIRYGSILIPAAPPVVAVLPFENLSGDPQKDYFARGVAIEIIDTLSQVRGVEVISKNSTLTMSPNADPIAVGKQLGVTHVLSGSVETPGGSTHISVQLADAKKGTAIWTQSFVPFEERL